MPTLAPPAIGCMISPEPASDRILQERPRQPRLAAVAVTFNSSGEIHDWISSFEDSGLRDQVELCVVDSGSKPEERLLLTETVAPRVDEFVLRPNWGYGRCCNVGAAHTKADTLLFLNPDAELVSLPSRFLTHGLPDGMLLGAMKRLEDGRLRPLGFTHLPDARWQAENMLLGRFSRAFRYTAERPAWVSGAAMLIKRADFEAVGGFSEDIFLYFEDADLCARHRRRGGIVEVDSEFLIDHAGQASSSGEHGLDAVSRWSGRIFVSRHGGALRARLLYALLVVYYLPRKVLVSLVRRVLGRGSFGRPISQIVLDMLHVRRVLRRLGVPH